LLICKQNQIRAHPARKFNDFSDTLLGSSNRPRVR
jgi:hypothetical protein